MLISDLKLFGLSQTRCFFFFFEKKTKGALCHVYVGDDRFDRHQHWMTFGKSTIGPVNIDGRPSGSS